MTNIPLPPPPSRPRRHPRGGRGGRPDPAASGLPSSSFLPRRRQGARPGSPDRRRRRRGPALPPPRVGGDAGPSFAGGRGAGAAARGPPAARGAAWPAARWNAPRRGGRFRPAGGEGRGRRGRRLGSGFGLPAAAVVPLRRGRAAVVRLGRWRSGDLVMVAGGARVGGASLGGFRCGEEGERLGQGRRSRRRAGCSAKAGTLRASAFPAGPVRPRAWCVPAIASGQLPSSAVEVGPSRVPTVLLPWSRLLFFIVQTMLHGAVVRQRGMLHDRVGAEWRSVWW